MTLSDIQARQLQALLASLGLYEGQIDGQVGPKTIHGVFELEQYLESPPLITVAAHIPPGLSLLQTAILTAAQRFVGLSEIKSNNRWDDLSTPSPDQTASELRASLLRLGWEPGEAYCIGGAEVVWQAGFAGASRTSDFLPFSKLINLSVLSSYENLQEAGKTTKTPKPGAIFFAQHGETAQGHAGIVTAVHTDSISTIEFNTSPTPADAAKDRDGDGVYAKTRPLNFTRSSGLWLRGFCNPPI